MTRFPEGVPTLTDGAVTLRPHRSTDADGALEQARDPLSRRWTTVPLEYHRGDAQRFVSQVMPGGWLEDSEWGFAVEAADDDGIPRYAGTVSLRHEGSGRAEVAFGAHPWARGRGVMERALRLLLPWGFAERGLRTVVWQAHRGNWASRRLAWRLGFRLEGELRRWLPQRGELRDAWVGTLLPDDDLHPATQWLDVPRIVGAEVVLRRSAPGDAPRVVEACTDPETRRWLGMLPDPYTLADAEAFLEGQEELHAAGKAVVWSVADAATGVLVGALNLFDVRPGVDAELGYWVHPAARGRGVATQACRLALRHAFVPVEDGGLGLGRVWAVAAEGNGASRRVLEKSGLVHQGRERRAVRIGGGALADGAIYDAVAGELPL